MDLPGFRQVTSMAGYKRLKLWANVPVIARAYVRANARAVAWARHKKGGVTTTPYLKRAGQITSGRSWTADRCPGNCPGRCLGECWRSVKGSGQSSFMPRQNRNQTLCARVSLARKWQEEVGLLFHSAL